MTTVIMQTEAAKLIIDKIPRRRKAGLSPPIYRRSTHWRS
ncbi:MAG: hypothetical protein ACLS4Z_03705 [Christensenellaceae bacterium]